MAAAPPRFAVRDTMSRSAAAVTVGILVVSGISAAAHTADPDDGLVSVAAFELFELAFLSDEPEAS